jgi:Tfp pilus assembly protein PilX
MRHAENELTQRRFTMLALRKRLKRTDLQSQRGAALVMAIMILLILTVLGIYAVTTSTLETKIAGNERFLKDAFYAADGGIDYGRTVVALSLNNQSFSWANPHNEDQLNEEIRGFGSCTDPDDPDCAVRPEIGSNSMTITINRLMSDEPPGYSSEFGAPVSEKQTAIYYSIDSISQHELAGTSAEIAATYRHVLHK